MLGAVSFAHEDTRTPMLTALAGLATATVGAVVLFPRYGHVGVAAAIAVSGWVGATLLAIVLMRRGWLGLDRDAARRLPRIVLATLIMGAVIAGLHMLIDSTAATAGSPPARIVALIVLVAAGLAIYLASLQALGVAQLRELLSAVRHPR
jgi:putative peptidoglycan lipid II flippase